MTILQIAILIVVVLLCFASVMVYYFQQKKATQLHLQNLRFCTEGISTHKQQIERRQDYLNKYDFLRQNISEALHVQQEIDISG